MAARWKLGRRRLLTQIGVGALAVAAATFGRSSPAYAASCGCCNLYHCPPNSSYSGCMSHPTYSWRCSYNNTQCQCCEQSGGGYTFSAYACWPR